MELECSEIHPGRGDPGSISHWDFIPRKVVLGVCTSPAFPCPTSPASPSLCPHQLHFGMGRRRRAERGLGPLRSRWDLFPGTKRCQGQAAAALCPAGPSREGRGGQAGSRASRAGCGHHCGLGAERGSRTLAKRTLLRVSNNQLPSDSLPGCQAPPSPSVVAPASPRHRSSPTPSSREVTANPQTPKRAPRGEAPLRLCHPTKPGCFWGMEPNRHLSCSVPPPPAFCPPPSPCLTGNQRRLGQETMSPR